MEREVIFRGKRLDNGQWLYGDLMHDNHQGRYVYPNDCTGLYTKNKVDPDTVGEFTGMRDKHGKKVFEGDIVRTNGCEEFFEVIYDAPDFCLKKNSSGYRFLNHPENFEVIGNIHDNPELLNKK